MYANQMLIMFFCKSWKYLDVGVNNRFSSNQNEKKFVFFLFLSYREI